MLADRPERRGGAGPKHRALLEVDGGPAATRSTGTAGLVRGVSTTGTVLRRRGDRRRRRRRPRAIWRFLLDIDWTSTIEADLLPLDHPLFLLARPSRGACGCTLGDGLWVRLVDVGAALSARTYAATARSSSSVRDAFCPWNEGRWRARRRRAPSEPTRDAELALDAAALGSAYLGGFSFAQLARGGRVEELAAGAVARADALFRHGTAPWCPEIF